MTSNPVSSKIILLFLIFLVSMKSQDSAKPMISCDQRKVNVGQVRMTKIVRVEFKLVNEGLQPLLISEVKTSCSCIPGFWSKDSIFPGDTAIVTLKYTPKPGEYGAFNESARVYSNAKNSPFSLFIQGHVIE